MRTLNRRAFCQIAALGAAASATACAPGTAPAVSPVGSDAAQVAAPPAVPTEEGEWEKAWDDVIAAAREEGKLSLLTLVGGGYARVIDRFQQAFPGITVDRLAESSASVWLGKVRRGRRARTSSFDLAFVPPTRALAEGGPEGMWAPIKPLLFRPDVLDDGVWRDGLHARFIDAGGNLCFAWEYQVVHAYAVNTDVVQEGDVRTVKDLLDPKWKGKILASDPRIGSGLLSAASVAQHWGTDVVKQLLVDQRPTFSRGGPSQITEFLARGRHPIALGVRPKALNPLRNQGLGHNVAYLDFPDADFVATISLLYFDRAPHPAAATLFANWILTSEGQTLLTSSLATNSARTDVEAFEPDGIGTAGKTYYEPDREANYRHTAETQKFIYQLLGRTP